MEILLILFQLTQFLTHGIDPDTTLQVKNGNNTIQTFSIEIADTQEKRMRGLMFRYFVRPNEGMFFEFPEEQILSFWMKNTPASLDIIFIDKNFVIQKIHRNLKSCFDQTCPTYSSEKPSKYVLEILGGLSQKLNIEEQNILILTKNKSFIDLTEKNQ